MSNFTMLIIYLYSVDHIFVINEDHIESFPFKKTSKDT